MLKEEIIDMNVTSDSKKSTWIEMKVNVRDKTPKLLEENNSHTCSSVFHKGFLNRTQKTWNIDVQNDKPNWFKVKCVCCSQNTAKKMEKWSIYREKIFANWENSLAAELAFMRY